MFRANNPKKNTFKCLFISRDTFPPYRVDVRILFGDEMVNRGHTIDWLLQSETACNTSYLTYWCGCRVWVGATDTGISRMRRLKRHMLSIMHDLKLFSLANKYSYDFIQVKDKFIAALFAIMAAKTKKIKFTYWLSFPFPEADLYAAKNRMARYPVLYRIRGAITKLLLYKILLPQADHIFVQSEQMKKDISKRGIPNEKMTVALMGISPEEIDNQRRTIRIPEETGCKSIIYLGALERIRKIDFLIRVFYQIQKREPNTEFYIVGDSDYPRDIEELKNEAKKLGIMDKVIFTGFLPMKDAWGYVAKAHVCISFIHPNPIFNAGSPTKLIEYMALEKPVVANDHPEQYTVISESRAGFCVPYEERAFTDAILEILDKEEQAREMGLNGRHYVVKNRSYKTIGNIVEKQYIALCNNTNR